MTILLSSMNQILRKASLPLLAMWLLSGAAQAQKSDVASVVTSQAFVICENCVSDSVIYSNIVNNPVYRANQNLKGKPAVGRLFHPLSLPSARFRASGRLPERFFVRSNDPAATTRILHSQTIAQFSDVSQRRHYEVRSRILSVISGMPGQGMAAASETNSNTEHVPQAQSPSPLIPRRLKRVLK